MGKKKEKVTQCVAYATGFTTSDGKGPFSYIDKMVDPKILAEVVEVHVTRTRGIRGYGKIWELVVVCEPGSPEDEWFKKNDLFDLMISGWICYRP